jgi:hypothetical protein
MLSACWSDRAGNTGNRADLVTISEHLAAMA